jgi:hypothetical protein
MSLNPDRVHVARTAGLTDSHLARLWRVTDGTVRRARRGETYPRHPTPADLAPRDGNGRGQNPIAKPARVRRAYLIEGSTP